ncbi:MAG TPA: DUF1611 domain-containing protein [Cyclobacteriaceae bacterium]|jgi:uncharacterized NAD-dependent epimerase/dehydratase family protein
MKSNAIIITAGILDDIHAKTTHGLVRGTDKFNIVGVIDSNHAGKDAGEVIDGKKRNIPVFRDFEDFRNKSPQKAELCIIGVATKGGRIPAEMRDVIKEAISSGYGIVNGLHEFVSEIKELKELAGEKGVELIDIRKPRPRNELRFWSGEIYRILSPIIAVLGVDCAVGKRTTSRMLVQSMKDVGINAEMIYTGQTGWLCGIKHGFIFDATYNDFISGEVEAALLSCYDDQKPEVIFIEGQSGLRNPSGPCGSEFLLSGNAKGSILQVVPHRKNFKGFENLNCSLPSATDEIALIKMYNSEVIGITVNTEHLTKEESFQAKTQLEKETRLPVALPLFEGVEPLVPALVEYVKNYKR